MTDHLPDLRTWSCFACGQDHPKGLRLRFTAPGPDRIRSEFTVSTDHTGLGRIVHGGIVATIFDEAMVWSLYRWRYAPHVTATMSIRFRGPVEADTPLVVESWIDEDRGRRRSVAAEIRDPRDTSRPLADATGLYLPLGDGGLDDLDQAQRDELETVFAHFRGQDGAAL